MNKLLKTNLSKKKCRAAECGAECVQAAGSSLSLLVIIFYFFVFLRRLCSTEGCLPPKVVFYRRLPSTKGHLKPKVICHQRLTPTEGCLPLKVVFHRRSSSTYGRLPPKVVFHQSLSSTKGCPPTITFCLILYLWEQSKYKISAKQNETRAHMLLLLRTTKISKAMIFLKSNLSKVSKKTFVRAGQCACLPCANNLIFVQYFYNLLINIHLIVDPNVTPEFRVDTPFCLNPNATCPSKFNLL